MCKKTLALISITIASAPFSFVEMKGPFTKTHVTTVSRESSAQNQNFNPIEVQVKSPYLFLYNSKTGYVLSFNPTNKVCEDYNSEIEKDNLLSDLLQGKNNFKELDCNGFFYFNKEKPNLKYVLNEWVNTNIDRFYFKIHDTICSYYFDKNSGSIITDNQLEKIGDLVMGFREDFKVNGIYISLSEVYFNIESFGIKTIDNENKVVIKKTDDSVLDFYQALHNYYTQKKYDNIDKDYDVIRDAVAHAINNSNVSTEKNLKHNSYEIQKSANVIADHKSSLDLLEKSTILSVYWISIGKLDKPSIILGLAKNNETNKNFHWLVDLEEEDISVLLKEPKGKSVNTPEKNSHPDSETEERDSKRLKIENN